MFERFTDRARRVVVFAQEEARRLKHDYIGTEHLLLGLIYEREGVAAKSLAALGVELPEARRRIQEVVGTGSRARAAPLPFTPRAKKVLEFSLREALEVNNEHIGTEHILLGLIREGEGVAAQVLQQMGVDLDRARRQVMQLVVHADVAESAEGMTVVEMPAETRRIAQEGPACPRCRTPLNDALGIRTVDATRDEGEDVISVRLAYCRSCGATVGVGP